MPSEPKGTRIPKSRRRLYGLDLVFLSSPKRVSYMPSGQPHSPTKLGCIEATIPSLLALSMSPSIGYS